MKATGFSRRVTTKTTGKLVCSSGEPADLPLCAVGVVTCALECWNEISAMRFGCVCRILANFGIAAVRLLLTTQRDDEECHTQASAVISYLSSFTGFHRSSRFLDPSQSVEFVELKGDISLSPSKSEPPTVEHKTHDGDTILRIEVGIIQRTDPLFHTDHSELSIDLRALKRSPFAEQMSALKRYNASLQRIASLKRTADCHFTEVRIVVDTDTTVQTAAALHSTATGIALNCGTLALLSLACYKFRLCNLQMKSTDSFTPHLPFSDCESKVEVVSDSTLVDDGSVCVLESLETRPKRLDVLVMGCWKTPANIGTLIRLIQAQRSSADVTDNGSANVALIHLMHEPFADKLSYTYDKPIFVSYILAEIADGIELKEVCEVRSFESGKDASTALTELRASDSYSSTQPLQVLAMTERTYVECLTHLSEGSIRSEVLVLETVKVADFPPIALCKYQSATAAAFRFGIVGRENIGLKPRFLQRLSRTVRTHSGNCSMTVCFVQTNPKKPSLNASVAAALLFSNFQLSL